MEELPTVERINPELRELMDRFFEVSRQDLDKMRQALSAEDFITLERLGHTAKGTGVGYGFKGMGLIGRDIESAAKIKDGAMIAEQVERMEHYLDTVTVTFDS